MTAVLPDRWLYSRITGRFIRPFPPFNSGQNEPRPAWRRQAPTPPVTVVTDPEDTVELGRQVAGLACRRAGRVVVHTGARQSTVTMLYESVAGALGKHHARTFQHCLIPLVTLTDMWLWAEQVREVIVLRAHQVQPEPLRQLVGLLGRLRIRLWLLTPEPLPGLDALGADCARLDPDRLDGAFPACPPTCECEDLNLVPARSGTVADVRWSRRLYDPETAAIATACVLLGRIAPAELVDVRVGVAGRELHTADGGMVEVPEYARALLRNHAGRSLAPADMWSPEAAETYLTLRLEDAERCAGIGLLDPSRPLPAPVAWRQRYERGAQALAWLTRG